MERDESESERSSLDARADALLLAQLKQELSEQRAAARRAHKVLESYGIPSRFALSLASGIEMLMERSRLRSEMEDHTVETLKRVIESLIRVIGEMKGEGDG